MERICLYHDHFGAVYRVHLDPKERVPRERHHGYDRVLAVIEGMLWIELAEATSVVGQGQKVIVPSGVWHTIINPSGAGLGLLELQSGLCLDQVERS